jgi:uncharacterized protein
MYTSVDAVPPGPARIMSMRTVAQVGRRIAEHVVAHGRTAARVVLHGGEPLLVGVDTVTRVVAELRKALAPRIRLDCSIQTNGVLLTPAFLEALRTSGVRVGVSLDGDRAGNDLHRRFRDGRSSYPHVIRALALLREYPDIFAGILAVIDLASDPIETYESILAHAPPKIDLILPHGNWGRPPPGRPPDDSTPYGDWLVSVFDRWYQAPRQELEIRLFEEIIAGLFGRPSRIESIGLSPVGVIVIDVAGGLEQVDALRTTFVGARETGLNVFDHAFDVALRHPKIRIRQGGLDGLSDTCLRCPVHPVCGGGYYPHRYAPGRDFRNPSVYSADLRRLIEHIARRVRNDVSRIRAQASYV